MLATVIYKALIVRVLTWLTKFTAEDFEETAKAVVTFARRTDLTGAQKRDEVIEWLKPRFASAAKVVGTAALNVLIELAVSYARRTGQA